MATTLPTLDQVRSRREEILALAAHFGLSNVRVFGSVARGESRPESDLDLLVEVEPGRGLDFIRFKSQLEELLGCPVDLVTESALYWRMRGPILREAVPL